MGCGDALAEFASAPLHRGPELVAWDWFSTGPARLGSRKNALA